MNHKNREAELERKQLNRDLAEETAKITEYYEDLTGITAVRKKKINGVITLKREFKFKFTYKLESHRWVFRGPELTDDLKKELMEKAQLPIEFRINKKRFSKRKRT